MESRTHQVTYSLKKTLLSRNPISDLTKKSSSGHIDQVAKEQKFYTSLVTTQILGRLGLQADDRQTKANHTMNLTMSGVAHFSLTKI